MTPFGLLCDHCGLSERVAAALFKVPENQIQKWRSGRRTAPVGIMAELRALDRMIERAAREAIATIIERREPENAICVVLGHAVDDHEALSLGWPSVDVQAAMLRRVVAGMPEDLICALVPRGSTVVTAAAADANGR